MAMTEEERRRARNEASKRWYLKHKAEKAVEPVAAKNPRKDAAPKKAAKNPGDAAAKLTAKTVKKFARTAAEAKNLVKECAETVGSIVKACTPDDAAKAIKLLAKELGVKFTPDFVEQKFVVTIPVSANVRIPKAMRADYFPDAGQPEEENHVEDEQKAEETPAEEAQKTEEEPVEVLVDPARLEGVPDGHEGEIALPDVIDAENGEEDDSGENEDEDEDEDDEEKEPDDFDDYDERDAERGRGEFWNELEAMGVGEEDA